MIWQRTRSISTTKGQKRIKYVKVPRSNANLSAFNTPTRTSYIPPIYPVSHRSANRSVLASSHLPNPPPNPSTSPRYLTSVTTSPACSAAMTCSKCFAFQHPLLSSHCHGEVVAWNWYSHSLRLVGELVRRPLTNERGMARLVMGRGMTCY